MVFRCWTAIRKTVSLSNLCDMVMHMGTTRESSVMYVFILSLRRFSISLWFWFLWYTRSRKRQRTIQHKGNLHPNTFSSSSSSSAPTFQPVEEISAKTEIEEIWVFFFKKRHWVYSLHRKKRIKRHICNSVSDDRVSPPLTFTTMALSHRRWKKDCRCPGSPIRPTRSSRDQRYHWTTSLFNCGVAFTLPYLLSNAGSVLLWIDLWCLRSSMQTNVSRIAVWPPHDLRYKRFPLHNDPITLDDICLSMNNNKNKDLWRDC